MRWPDLPVGFKLSAYTPRLLNAFDIGCQRHSDTTKYRTRALPALRKSYGGILALDDIFRAADYFQQVSLKNSLELQSDRKSFNCSNRAS